MAKPGEFVAEYIVTAVDLNALPGGVLGYAQRTSDQTGIGTSLTDLTGLTVTVNVVASRRIKVTGHADFRQQTNLGTPRGFVLEGSTQLGAFGGGSPRGTGSSGFIVMDGSVILTPSSGSHTYKLSALTLSDTVNMTAAADNPAFILVEDIGPA